MNSVQFGGFTFVRGADYKAHQADIQKNFGNVLIEDGAGDQVSITSDARRAQKLRQLLKEGGISHRALDEDSQHFTWVNGADYSQHQADIQSIAQVPMSDVAGDKVFITGDSSLERKYRRFLDSQGIAHRDLDQAEGYFTFINETAYNQHRRAIQEAFPDMTFSELGGDVGDQEKVLMTANEKLAKDFQTLLAERGIPFDKARKLDITEIL